MIKYLKKLWRKFLYGYEADRHIWRNKLQAGNFTMYECVKCHEIAITKSYDEIPNYAGECRWE